MNYWFFTPTPITPPQLPPPPPLPNSLEFFTNSNYFRPGLAGLQLYSQIHHNTVNQVIHGLGMPFVGYAVFGLANLLSSNNRAGLIIYLSYFLYYLQFDLIGSFYALLIYLIPLAISFYDYQIIQFYYPNTIKPSYQLIKSEYLAFYAKIFALSILIQEGIGHFCYERFNSDLYQLPNSISQAPLFGTRALMHNWLNYPLLPNAN